MGISREFATLLKQVTYFLWGRGKRLLTLNSTGSFDLGEQFLALTMR